VTAAEFLITVASWAAEQPDLQGLALVGSYARNAAHPDSDIDLVLLSRQVASRLANTAWVSSFGSVKQQQIERWGRVTSIRVGYADGLEVEFGVTTPDWADLPVDPGTRRVVADGMRILFDASGRLDRLRRDVCAGS